MQRVLICLLLALACGACGGVPGSDSKENTSVNITNNATDGGHYGGTLAHETACVPLCTTHTDCPEGQECVFLFCAVPGELFTRCSGEDASCNPPLVCSHEDNRCHKPGTSKEGYRCRTNVECQEALYCSSTCAPRRSENEGCFGREHRQCQAHLFCDARVHACAPRRAEGEPCRFDEMCRGELRCLPVHDGYFCCPADGCTPP